MIKNYQTKVLIFFLCIFLFSFVYYTTIEEISFEDAFFISSSYQTLCGTNLDSYPKKIKRIATIQMILSYLIIANIFYYFLHFKKMI